MRAFRRLAAAAVARGAARAAPRITLVASAAAATAAVLYTDSSAASCQAAAPPSPFPEVLSAPGVLPMQRAVAPNTLTFGKTVRTGRGHSRKGYGGARQTAGRPQRVPTACLLRPHHGYRFLIRAFRVATTHSAHTRIRRK
jgi:hypothetical protein